MDKINLIKAVKTGWRCTKEHFIVSLGLVLAYMVVSMLFSFLPATGITGIICQLLSFVITCIWGLGIARLSIDVVDGDEPRFGVFGEMLPRIIAYALMTIVMYLLIFVPFIIIIAIGATVSGVSTSMLHPDKILELIQRLDIWFILGIIPSLYLGIRLYFAPYILVDRGVGAIEALKMSWKSTAPIQGKIFLFFLIQMVMTIIGCLCLFVGVFVAMITLMYAQAALYRQAFPAGIQEPLLVEDANMVMS